MSGRWRGVALALLATGCRAAAPDAGAMPVAVNGGGASSAPADSVVTVRDVLARPELVGRTVTVTGRCLGYGTIRASGPPPRTRSDWQLAEGAAAVWVTGARPTDCSATEGSTHDDTITARVAQDTVRVVATDPGQVRRYLVRASR